MDQEKRYLDYVLEVVHERIAKLAEKMGENAKDMESMNEYFWENYTEFDEYGYEMYDNRMALRTGVTQQEQYAKERGRYEKMLDNPYFGRVDFCYDGEQEAEIYYIGIGNLAKEKGAHPIVFDWRAPVSALFYDYDKGAAQFVAPAGTLTGEITRKRQYKIRYGKLVFMLETDLNIDDEILQQALSEHADASLKSIVSTIQREQNSIIRDTAHKIMVVQGCAGSGKTSVALHRIAYLLYHSRGSLQASQVLVLSPNSIFGDYISRILPELGEEAVCEMTLDDFAYRELREYGEAQDFYDELEQRLHEEKCGAAAGHAAMRADGAADGADTKINGEAHRWAADEKQSRAFVRELDAFILQLEWDLMEIRDVSIGRQKMSADEISAFFYEKFCDVPILSRMKKIGEYLIDSEETLRGKDMEEEERQAVLDKMNALYRTTDILDLYNEFLLQSGRTQTLESGEETPYQLVRGAEIPYEDVYALLYLKYSTTETRRRRKIKHLVIDEMQDYSYLHYLVLQKLFDCPMTILGDMAQGLSGQQRNVMDFLPHIFGKEIFYVEMSKSYRSTAEIMACADNLLEGKNAARNHYVQRHGETPAVEAFANRADQYDALARQIKEQKEMHTIAVLCTDADAAKKAGEELCMRGVGATVLRKESMKFVAGISVMPFYLAKGLEFDAVFVPDMQDYHTPILRQSLYINATRALHVLWFLKVT